jgi:SfnB family sulfur acquisition oxidoreductase
MNRAGFSEMSTTISMVREEESISEELSRSKQVPRSGEPTKTILDDANAMATAEELAVEMARNAADRDRNRRLPYGEIKSFAESGLLGVTIPKRWGGAEVSITTLGAIMRMMAAADPNIAQIAKNHFLAIDIMLLNGSDEQKKGFFDEVLKGRLVGHAASERGTKDVLEIKTRLTRSGPDLLLNGEKFYATGALFCDWIAVGAIDGEGHCIQAFVPRHAHGVTVIDDWSGFGQRTTASGTAKFDDVIVDPSHIVSLEDAYLKPTLAESVSQFLHACIGAGIASAAIDEAMLFVNTKARPWTDSGVSRACEDPYIISAVGDLKIRLFAAEASLERVGRRLDAIFAAVPSEDTVAVASVNVAVVKVLTTELAILATNKLFELSGASATLATSNLDRHWRNARTHTLHDPVGWKYNVVGNFYLNCVNPRRHNYV